MFKSLIQKVKAVMYRMGLIAGVKRLTDKKEIPVDDEMYNLIEQMKAIYAGYYDKWHDVEYMTISGKKKRRRATLNMPKVVSRKMTTLIYNERCEINISDKATEEYIKQVFKNNRFNTNFSTNLEYGFALGGMVMKPYLEDNEIRISFTTADCFIPLTWTNTRITEGVFVSTFRKEDNFYTHLEWHVVENGVYTVKNELYRSKNEGEIGVQIALDTYFDNGLEDIVSFPTVKKPLFAYFKPNIANNFVTNSPLGISIFANALDTFKSIDIKYDSLQREFILGKKRIIVPNSAIKTSIDPETNTFKRYFDAEDEVYEAMNFGDMDADKIKDISVSLRVQEHIDGINSDLKLLATQLGFNAGTFTFDGTGIKTATEVISEKDETFRTKEDHETNVEVAIQELVDAILELSDVFGIFNKPDKYQISVAFDDSIVEDANAEIDKQIKLVTNGLTTKIKALQEIHGITEEEAKVMYEEIKAEQRTVSSEVVDLFGVSSQTTQSTQSKTSDE